MSNTSVNNQGLFSNYFLSNRMPDEPDLWEVDQAELEDRFQKLKSLYSRIEQENLILPGEESKLEDRFIRPVFSEVLNLEYDSQAKTLRGGKAKHPDQALFTSVAKYENARKGHKDLVKYWSEAAFVSESKYWSYPLNPVVKKEKYDNPTTQMIGYMTDIYERIFRFSRHIWGILTNGKFWRLHTTHSSNWAAHYLEIDIEEIIKTNDMEGFRYFYLIFGSMAFDIIPKYNHNRLTSILDGSIRYSKDIGRKIKDNIYENIFEKVAQGFLDYRRRYKNVKAESSDIEDTLFQATLTLLFRLLFVLYAEARGLLPSDHPRYGKFSLDTIARESIRKLYSNELDGDGLGIWAQLRTLFKKINKGDQECNLPVYNGGLFKDSGGHLDKGLKFLRDNEINDIALAEAIKALVVDTESPSGDGEIAFIDYSSLGVRHLGEIYEGLLEFRIALANEEMTLITNKLGHKVWKPMKDMKDRKNSISKSPDEVYITNDQGERKQYGSYYTPDYIVSYLIRETISPVIEKRIEEINALENESRALLKKIRKTSNTQVIRRILRPEYDRLKKETVEKFNIKILDPAMGSGHFLVEAVDFISNRLNDYISSNPGTPFYSYIEETRRNILDDLKRQGISIDEEKLTDDKLIKRVVLKKCIYGVDLNPMAVELAKLSLWLDSFVLGAPLSFLDHHLKFGNSLVGSGDISSHIPQNTCRYQEFLLNVSNLIMVSELTDSTISQVEQSARLYNESCRWMEPTKERLNVDSAQHFGEFAKILSGKTKTARAMALGHAMDVSYKKSRRPVDQQNFIIAQTINDSRHFFHWEIEFPEIYFSRAGKLETPGFDCVVGNPPYIRVQTLDDEDKVYFKNGYITPFKNFDIYILFVEKGLSLLKPGGNLAYIMPNKFYSLEYARKLRKMLTDKKYLENIVDFGDNQIFPEQTTYTNLLFLSKKENEIFNYTKIDALTSPEKELPIIFEDELTDERCKRQSFSTAQFSETPWSFITEERINFDRIFGNCIPLGNLVKKIFVGVQTSADDVYIMNIIKEEGKNLRLFSDSLNREVVLERDLLMPLISGEDVDRYSLAERDKLILFPYNITNDKYNLVSQDRVKSDLPLTYDYLLKNEARLRNREKGKMDHDRWYAYIYPKNIAKQNKIKICVPRLVNRLKNIIDVDGSLCLDNVDVNGIFVNESEENRYIISALLNSKLLDYYFKIISVRFRGKYYSANKQFLYPLPIHKDYSSFRNKEKMILKVKDIMKFNVELKKQSINFRDRLNYEYQIKISKSESRFFTKEFEDFLNCLRKEKADLKGKSLGIKDLFTEYRDILRELDNRITTIDEEIDNLVFRLYEVNQEEEKVIRESYNQ